MELQYSILWFEDSDRLLRLYEKRIGRYLDDLGGFSLDLTHKEDTGNLDQCLNQDYDLILVDWNLNPDESGDTLSGEELIREIRRREIFTEIIFYSGIDDFEAQEFKLDGVYFTNTDDENLLSKIQEIIKHTLRRSLRTSVTRGQFIASTIDLVEKMENIISRILKLSNDQLAFFQDLIIQAGFFNDRAKFDIIKEFLGNEIEKSVKKMESPEGDEKEPLTEKVDTIKKIRKQFGKFLPEVIEIRNCLAHAKTVPNEKNTLRVWVKDKKCYEDWKFDLEKCRDIRMKFLAHEKNLEAILSLVNNYS